MVDIEIITETLEVCAEQSGDITSSVYDRFFEGNDEAFNVMGHSDDYMRGRMMEQVYKLLMSDEQLQDDGYVKWELANHTSYGVESNMYEAFLFALRDIVRDSVGAAWTADSNAAWDARINKILGLMENRASAD
jgi:hemoglobin-like flavoprotein